MLELEIVSRKVKTVNKNIMTCVLQLLFTSVGLYKEDYNNYICPNFIRNEKK